MNEQSIIHFEKTSISKFDPNTMDYLLWLNSLEHITDILRIKIEERGNFLLKMLEDSVMTDIVKRLNPFNNPCEHSYEEFTHALESIYGKYKGVEAAHYRFLHRNQFPYEPAEQYIIVLRKLFSKISPTMQNEDNLKARFVEGLENEEIKATLKDQYKHLTLDAIISIVNQIELARNEIKLDFD